VYSRPVGRTNIDLDDALVATVMERYGLSTKKDAVDYALRRLTTPYSQADILDLQGSGWDGDLAEMRGGGPLWEDEA